MQRYDRDMYARNLADNVNFNDKSDHGRERSYHDRGRGYHDRGRDYHDRGRGHHDIEQDPRYYDKSLHPNDIRNHEDNRYRLKRIHLQSNIYMYHFHVNKKI